MLYGPERVEVVEISPFSYSNLLKLLSIYPGIVQNELIGALAHLELGRAYVQLGETERARTPYEDFLSLWKDADRDTPALRLAQAEYAKLQGR
jgi:hypothetical protein